MHCGMRLFESTHPPAQLGCTELQCARPCRWQQQQAKDRHAGRQRYPQRSCHVTSWKEHRVASIYTIAQVRPGGLRPPRHYLSACCAASRVRARRFFSALHATPPHRHRHRQAAPHDMTRKDEMPGVCTRRTGCAHVCSHMQSCSRMHAAWRGVMQYRMEPAVAVALMCACIRNRFAALAHAPWRSKCGQLSVWCVCA